MRITRKSFMVLRPIGVFISILTSMSAVGHTLDTDNVIQVGRYTLMMAEPSVKLENSVEEPMTLLIQEETVFLVDPEESETLTDPIAESSPDKPDDTP